MATSSTGRRDVVWQRADTTRNYHRSRQAIPYADIHFDIAERVLRAHSVDVRHILDLGCGDGIATARNEHAVLGRARCSARLLRTDAGRSPRSIPWRVTAT